MAAVEFVKNLVATDKDGNTEFHHCSMIIMTLSLSLSSLSLCVRACACVCACIGHIHRQNCLKEFGVNFALQKLEKVEHKRLRVR